MLLRTQRGPNICFYDLNISNCPLHDLKHSNHLFSINRYSDDRAFQRTAAHRSAYGPRKGYFKILKQTKFTILGQPGIAFSYTFFSPSLQAKRAHRPVIQQHLTDHLAHKRRHACLSVGGVTSPQRHASTFKRHQMDSQDVCEVGLQKKPHNIIPSNHFHAIGYRHDFFNVLRVIVYSILILSQFYQPFNQKKHHHHHTPPSKTPQA